MVYESTAVTINKTQHSPVQANPQTRDADEAERAAERRRLYERIARGNALAEAEEAARRVWAGK